ncbi:acyl-CoA N-acyltransferase [Pseudomassariella vexata]|uniref:N-alpha-acetyltransferase 40 n=1 Tax=Pseudomassariella vexata TaxID=1141098 RepID=A0A1Y2DF20_9PEZI|nr:acyl-CoA N-acyltransferase [Pseudomassariella vexata]ORY57871.1 acyl-CoA N-acyltransferase [Pseudomassariella vexata]
MSDLKSTAKRRRTTANAIEHAIRKSDEEFIAQYLQPSPSWTEWIHPRTDAKYTISLISSGALAEKDLKSCLSLVEETSRADYEPSSLGWKPAKKLDEMKSPELRYIVVKDGQGDIRGFTSLMPTYEEGQPVVYCYEIHLKGELQGTRLGKLLISFLEDVAVNVPTVEKVMLTCFTSNKRALDFYKKLGFKKDDISPEPRRLRYGKEVVPDYVIMSKVVGK